jgi:hypothetical protein
VRLLAAALLCAFVSAPRRTFAQDVSAKEYQIKAVFLFNFVQFAQWPESAFASPTDPIRIGVLGESPFANSLADAVAGETVRQRPIVIHRATRLEEIMNCHVVFVCRSERAQVAPILAALGNRPVLTVGDMPDFARRGGIINFYLEGQKVRFEINRAAALQSGLKLSSQLLSLARLVGPPVAAGDR